VQSGAHGLEQKLLGLSADIEKSEKSTCSLNLRTWLRESGEFNGAGKLESSMEQIKRHTMHSNEDFLSVFTKELCMPSRGNFEVGISV